MVNDMGDLTDYWKIRATKYNDLNWTKDERMLNKFIDFCDLYPNDIVLDAGCGTGVISKLIANRVQGVMAIDKSEDMLSKAEFDNNIIKYACCDIETFSKNRRRSFDKIISRMVFHHLDNVDEGFRSCYGMLKHEGWLLVEEGLMIPSQDKRAIDWYINMMSLKEKRSNFTVTALTDYFKKHHFANITKQIIKNPNFSVNNWLENSGQDKSLQNKLYSMHYNAPSYVKETYNMRIEGDEITIQTEILFIKGQKDETDKENCKHNK